MNAEMPLMDELPARIRSKSEPDEASGCWLANVPLDEQGYARVRFEGVRRYLHRLVYELLVGPVPDGLELDHLCRVRHCCNPEHLEPVTHAENMRRGRYAVMTECTYGHPFDEVNTRWVKRANGSRMQRDCRECDRLRRRGYRERRREAAAS